ncbi:MAG: LAGLIDADG family homing endonuclease [Gallionella sp.]
MQYKNENVIYLKSNEQISDFILNKLKKANSEYSKTKNFSKYKLAIQDIFKLNSLTKITIEAKYYLAGFLEGEGSISVGIKKNNSTRFKLYLDPEFNITQHINGISNLFLAMLIFNTGRIRYKAGSNATFVYTIDNRKSLEEKIIPFYENYVNKYGCEVKKNRLLLFKKLLNFFNKKAHLNFEQLVFEILPLWDKLRIQVGQSNESFKNLEEAQEYVKNVNSNTK